jgi:two-component system CheB/CheR fusion protein
LGKDERLQSFTKRLTALGRVQSLVSGAVDEYIDLGDIVRLEIQALGGPAEKKVSISGSRALLGLEYVQTLALALHELTTNAVKYGALKDPAGHLDIAWEIRRNDVDEAVLVLDWRESGVSNMPEAPGRGFGRQMIERALHFTTRAKTDLTFGPNGIACHIEIPLGPSSIVAEPSNS